MVQRADLVLEGGGVKGAGLVGAVGGLEQSGFSWVRIAGTSAGAFVGALLAAGYPASVPDPNRPTLPTLHQVMQQHPLASFADDNPPSHLGIPGEIASAIIYKGMYKGDALHAFMTQMLGTVGVHTWGDLRLADADSDPSIPPAQRYKLMVVVTDHTRHQMLRLPWDFEQFGYTQAQWDKLPVADAVVASCRIPGVFEPFIFTSMAGPGNPAQQSQWVDGGVCSNFPVDAFDRLDSQPPRWPTIGVRLNAKPSPTQRFSMATDPYNYYLSLYETVLNGRDNELQNDPLVMGRSIFVDTSSVSATDFNVTPAQTEMLYQTGMKAGLAFGKSFSMAAYIALEQPLRRILAQLRTAAKRFGAPPPAQHGLD